MAQSPQQKLAEAEKLVKSGKKHCSKGFFKKPDWDSGATDFDKALKIYMHLANVQLAKETVELMSDAHVKAGNLYLAASAMESFAAFLRDQKREGETPGIYVRAARLYAQDNKPQQQADALAKAARNVTPEQTDEAIGWMRESITSLEESERWHMVREPYRALLLILIRANRLVDAIEVEKQFASALQHMENKDMAAKCGLEATILALSLADTVLADRVFKEFQSTGYAFQGSREQSLAYELIDACERRDQQQLTAVAKEPQISFLNNDVARLAKKLKVPSGAPTKRPQLIDSDGNVVADSSAPAGGGDDGDDAVDEEEDCR